MTNIIILSLIIYKLIVFISFAGFDRIIVNSLQCVLVLVLYTTNLYSNLKYINYKYELKGNQLYALYVLFLSLQLFVTIGEENKKTTSFPIASLMPGIY